MTARGHDRNAFRPGHHSRRTARHAQFVSPVADEPGRGRCAASFQNFYQDVFRPVIPLADGDEETGVFHLGFPVEEQFDRGPRFRILARRAP